MTADPGGGIFPVAASEKARNGCRRRFKIRKAHRSGQRHERKREPPVARPPDDEEEEKPIEISLSFSSSSSENDGAPAGEDDDRARERKRERSINYGSLSVIGRRREMEDAVRVEQGFAKRLKADEVYDFFGVYDGHGGARVAEACRERLHRLVAEEVEGRDREGREMDWEGTMVGCFGKMDGEVTSGDAAEEMKTVGSTAVVAVVGREVVVVANCGDSRAVLCRGGVAMALTDDHKPNRPDELKRVEAAGGRVINWNGHRILGVLATSRSIGDQYLKPFVIPEPEIKVSGRPDEEENPGGQRGGEPRRRSGSHAGGFCNGAGKQRQHQRGRGGAGRTELAVPWNHPKLDLFVFLLPTLDVLVDHHFKSCLLWGFTLEYSV
ncbi:protein phosphatase 2C 51 isoform X1 [Eucalyptus grandis]|uniref:protein phosphatase 2C 51 isoform X1 n=1 Tax=Eucalyptus grandis TaxID=71139 RepID=UPI00192E9D79|nr:protein phosphatase 2C 51 isoform X1 [Eucalyptus grandis]